MIKSSIDILFEVLKKPEHGAKGLKLGELWFFSGFLKPFWKLFLLSIVLTIMTTALGSLLPLSSKVLIDFIILGKGLQQIGDFLRSLGLDFMIEPVGHVLGSVDIVILIVLFMGIAMGLLGVAQKMLGVKLQQDITFTIQTTLFDKILRFPLSLLKERQVGYLMSRVSNDVNVMQSFFGYMLPQLFTYFFYALFCFGILFKLNNKASFILLGLFPVWICINYFFAVRMRSVSHREMEGHAQVSQNMQEAISGVEVIKTNVTETLEVDRLSGSIRGLFHTRILSALLNSLSELSMKSTKLIALLFIVWFSVKGAQNGEMSVGDITALLAYVIFLSGLASGLLTIFLSLQSVFASVERVRELFNIVSETTDTPSGNKVVPEKSLGEIRFDNVSFSYENDKPVLDDITFTIRPGDVAAIIGPSGSGKTTLINLLIKFHMPGSGKIFLDGHDLRNVDTAWLRKQIGFVSQDIFLFNDTIEHNIKYGNPLASMEDVVNAATNAGIHREIETYQNGYQTIVGERGVKLSAGQRQRISMARAFLKNAPLLILDEPTSALDSQTESELIKSLKELTKNRTAIMISHRMSLTRIATRLFSLDNQTISERYETFTESE